MDRVVASAPASSANLGPGYDCLGVALPLRSELTVERTGTDDPPAIEVQGEGADVLRRSLPLAVRAFARVHGDDLRGLRFTFANRIPLGVGAGSSSAAIVAGLAAGLALADRPTAPEDVLPDAVELEGHPDNVAAALLGGFTIAIDGTPPHAERIEPPDGLAFVLVLPPDGVPTRTARAALKTEVPLADAVFGLQRVALLVHAVHAGELELLRPALDDRLHQPIRAELAPLLPPVRERAAALGALGATLSGAGPGVLVWTHHDDAASVAEALAAEHDHARVEVLAADRDGLVVSGA